LARSANADTSLVTNTSWGRARLQARVDPAVLPAQIFAVDQLGASQPRPQTRTPQAFDRTAVELVSPLALGQQSARPG
jgi:hypothetical protein